MGRSSFAVRAASIAERMGAPLWINKCEAGSSAARNLAETRLSTLFECGFMLEQLLTALDTNGVAPSAPCACLGKSPHEQKTYRVSFTAR